MMAQESIRGGEEMITIREVVQGKNSYDEETTTVFMQDGSKQVSTKGDEFFSGRARRTLQSNSSIRTGSSCRKPPPGTRWAMTATTPRSAGRTVRIHHVDGPERPPHRGVHPAGGRSTQVPVELIDNISLVPAPGFPHWRSTS